MKGYRTIIFSSIMALTGMVGAKVSPDTASHWSDLFFAAWGIGAILIRQITDTPVGKAAVPNVLSAEDVNAISQNIALLLNHSKISLQAANVTMGAIEKFENLVPLIKAVASELPLPHVIVPPDGYVAPQGDPAAQVPAGDGNPLSPSPVVPAQPVDLPTAAAVVTPPAAPAPATVIPAVVELASTTTPAAVIVPAT